MKTHFNLANAATASRLIISPFLILLPFSNISFLILYILCGLSDILDGFFARRFGTASVFGARLDTCADLVFVVSILAKLFMTVSFPPAAVCLAAASFFLKLSAALASKIRLKHLDFPHTYLNKLAGFLFFLYPLSVYFIKSRVFLYILCVTCVLASAEELAIALLARFPDPDAKCIFSVIYPKAPR